MPDEQRAGTTIEKNAAAALAPEQTEQIEQTIDVPVEQAVATVVEELPPPAAAAPVRPVATASTSVLKDPLIAEVEVVLSENISEIYKKLPENKKALFRHTGEHVAAQISQMIKSGIMQIKKVLLWIRQWLQIIPGVNEFFLEQEAKIKSDKIRELFDRQHAPA